MKKSSIILNNNFEEGRESKTFMNIKIRFPLTKVIFSLVLFPLNRSLK